MIVGKLLAAAAAFLAATVRAEYDYTPYSKTVACSAEEIRYPNTTEQISAIVKEAALSFKKVKALGSQHSANDIICTDGIAVSLSAFNKIWIDEPSKTVVVGGGAYLYQVLDALEAKGLMLPHFPAFGGITVGGAIATGAHGSSLKHPSTISDQIVQITLIDGLGRLRVIKNCDPDIDVVRVHLGLVGIITEVVFKAVPNYKVTVSTYPTSESLLFTGAFNQDLAKYDYYYMYWFPSVNQVAVTNGSYVPVATPGGDIWTVGGPIPPPAQANIQNLVTTYESLQTGRLTEPWCGLATNNFAAQYEPRRNSPYINPATFTPSNPATGFGRKIMNNHCVKGTCAWDIADKPLQLVDVSISIPIDRLPEAATAVKEILKLYPACLPFNGIFLRFVKGSNGLASTAAKRDSVYFEIVSIRRMNPTTDNRLDTDAISAISQLLIKEFEGRPHWGKNGLAMFQSRFLYKNSPGLQRFALSAATDFDPFGVFHNDWARRTFFNQPLPRGNGCGMEDNCFCRVDSECGPGQKCVKEKDWSVCRFN
ncbi:hypothetical protein HDU67_001151 [Dinochytrium kinnereticum]|nr:hypothetical protein HDU67_001151 [Dinochytrium kinnereticum]